MPEPDLESFKTGRAGLEAGAAALAVTARRIADLTRQQKAARAAGGTDAALAAELAQATEIRADDLRRQRQAQVDLQTLAGAVFLDPDRMIGTLGTGHPVTLLPVRIETRFVSMTEMQIRVYPDQIHLAQHNAEITVTEAVAAQLYWIRRAGVAEPSETAWTAVAAQLGPERAKYVVDLFEPVNFAALAPGVAPEFPEVATVETTTRPRPVARLLPSRWMVEITAPNGLRLYRGWFDKPVVPDLPVAPIGDQLDPTPAAEGEGLAALDADDPARWLIDFDRAVMDGMATTVRLAEGSFAAGISRLVVVGVDLGQTPAEAATALQEHLRAHGYADGFGVVPPGVPSNNTAVAGSDLSGRNRERAMRLAPAAGAVAGSDLGRLFAGLGLPGPVAGFAGFPDADQSAGDTVAALHTALWGASFGFYFGKFIAPLMTEATIGEVRGLIRDHVRPAGIWPTIRVGRQPYGVLPVLPPRTRVMFANSLEGGFDAALPEMIKRIRTFVEFSGVIGPNGEASPVRPLSTIPNLTNQPENTTSADVLARILKMGPVASRLSVRPGVGRLVNENAKPADRESRDLHRKVMDLVLASLGFSPQMLALQGKAPPIYDLALQTSSRFQLQDLPWVAADLSAADVMQTTVDKVVARIEATADPQRLLSIGANDAGTLLEGLLMLSAAFEYFYAAEQHIRHLAVSTIPTATMALMPEMIGLAVASPAAAVGAPAIIETPRQMLQLKGEATAGRSLLEFIDAVQRQPDPPPAMRDVQAFRTALDALRARPAAEVDHALRGLLDIGSHRLDAYLTALATRRLAAMRKLRPVGTHVGGYGVVHDLAPQTTPDSEGYVHLPSTDHAVTASILRAGHMANRDDDPNAFAVRLTSARMRAAIGVSDAMARGQSPSAVLGYGFERRLLDDRLRAQYILPFRKVAPHPTDAAPGGGGGPGDVSADSIPARDVVDGLALARMWMADKAKPLAELARALGHPVPLGDVAPLSGHLAQLADVFDAFGDLWTTEAVHQLARGNTARSAAAMAVVDRQEKPADPQVALTPRAAWGYAQRVFWIAEPGATAGWPEDLAGQTAAAVNAIAARMLGDPARFAIAVQAVDAEAVPLAGVEPVVIGLGDLGLSPISLVLMSRSGAGAGEQASQLEERIAGLALRQGILPTGPVAIAVQPPPRLAGGIGFARLLGLLDAARRALVGCRGLTLADFAVPDGGSHEDVDLSAAGQAVFDAATAACADLDAGLAESGLSDRVRVLAGLAACLPFGFRLPMWLLSGTEPDDAQLFAAGRAAQAHLRQALDGWAQDGDDDTAEKDRLRIGSVLGKDLPLAARLTLPPELAGGWQAALADQAALGAGEGGRAIRRWRRQMAMVRTPMRALADAFDAAHLTGHGAAASAAALAQFPHRAGTQWVGLPFETRNGVILRPDVSLSVVVMGEIDLTQPVAGLLIDAWTEAIPERQTATSLAFQYDAPNARPPQTVVVAVAPEEVTQWSADLLVSVVNETLDLAQLRLLAPNQIPGAGAVLPTAFVPTNLSDETPSWAIFDRVLATADIARILGKD